MHTVTSEIAICRRPSIFPQWTSGTRSESHDRYAVYDTPISRYQIASRAMIAGIAPAVPGTIPA